MLIYGSSFNIETFMPRLFKSRPIEAAVIPLPRDETTPPVMKIYLVTKVPPALKCKFCFYPDSGLTVLFASYFSNKPRKTRKVKNCKIPPYAITSRGRRKENKRPINKRIITASKVNGPFAKTKRKAFLKTFFTEFSCSTIREGRWNPTRTRKSNK